MILAIETSCDETAAAIVKKDSGGVCVLSSVVSSQIELHAPYGGVVPNLAAREHAKNIPLVVQQAIQSGNAAVSEISAIAVTVGPGLAPALHIGLAAAKTLAYRWKKPLLGIHHIEGHIYANFISEQAASLDHSKDPAFPILALIVSGGHTELVLMRSHFHYEILGETGDDAAGEAFDKVARMLGLPYPGGPHIAERASVHRQSANDKHPSLCQPFPRPLIGSGDFRFSFSGLKTSVLYFLKKHPDKLLDPSFVNAACFEFQESVVETLTRKTEKAIQRYQPKSVIIAGGVSANTELRTRISTLVSRQFPGTTFFVPPIKYSLDNAAMIAAAALFRWEFSSPRERELARNSWKTLRTDPNLPLGSLNPQKAKEPNGKEEILI